MDIKLIENEVWKRSPLLWVSDNHIRTEKGGLLDFKQYGFLKDVYDDWSPTLVVRKASQVGFSTLMILKTFNAAKFRNWNIIYTLPTFQDVGQFVPSKVNVIVDNNPILSEWTKDKDSVLQKKVGNRFIYYRGASSGKTEREKMESDVGIMITADLLSLDECDRSDQSILEQYESRLAGSDYAGRWYFSNPTHPHTLSQKIWDKSDQKHWFVKCEHCNEWQYLDFWKNVVDYKFVCSKCGKEISDEARMNGKWVRKYKDRDISGYWISHLICPWIPAEKIQQEYETKTKQYFYNFVLGLPYVGSDVVVNRDVILKNVDYSSPNLMRGNCLGVDQGLKKHWVLGNKQGIFKHGVYDKWEDIEKLIKVYDVETAVFDALPDLTEPRKLRDKYPGKIWLSYYKKEVKKADFISWDLNTRTVYSDRSKIIEQVIDEMVNRKIEFQIPAEELSTYIKHWESVYKVVETDNLGIERNVWETSGEDHFVHATILWRLAMEKGAGEDTKVVEYGAGEKEDTRYAPDIQEDIKHINSYEY